MTKIRATKDSPLAKQGEVFEIEKDPHGFDYVEIQKVGWLMEKVNEFISDGWFSVVEDKQKLSEEITSQWDCDGFNTIQEAGIQFASIAKRHAIEIVKEADKEFDCKRNPSLNDAKTVYIIQKLEERMR